MSQLVGVGGEEYYSPIILNPECCAPGATGNNGAVVGSRAATNV